MTAARGSRRRTVVEPLLTLPAPAHIIGAASWSRLRSGRVGIVHGGGPGGLVQPAAPQVFAKAHSRMRTRALSAIADSQLQRR